MGVVAALATVQIQQAACDIGEGQDVGVVVAQFVQAAAAAAVAERFPLVAVISSSRLVFQNGG